MEWWLWVVMGVALLVIEMATPGGLFAMFFGIGAFVVAPLASAGLSSAWQWVAFTVVSLALVATLRKLLREKMAARGQGLTDSVIGEQAVLLEDLPDGGEAKAELRGVPWTARAGAGVVLPKGRRCVVERVDGVTIWLRAE